MESDVSRLYVRHWSKMALHVSVLLLVLAFSSSAQAIPAFARKYGTSCQTCHTVYPKLTPFGEAFRRNGYRFPGVDSDYWKQDTIALGQEASKKTFPYSVWPGSLPNSVPLAFGFNGSALVHPDKNTTGAQADNGTNFTLQNLIAEAHLWAGGSYDDTITFWAEVTFATSGGTSVEKAQIIFSDLLGPKHLINTIVGRGVANLTSFGPHSSYIADTLYPSLPVTALFGAQGDSFNIGENYNSVEVNGVIAGRVIYNVGVSAGQHFDVRPTENFYGHLGAKFGGMRLDGEGSSGPTDAEHPWAENALTVDVFAYKSNSHFLPAGLATGAPPQQDAAGTIGGAVRGQLGSLELNAGLYTESHSHAQADGTGANALVQYNELSYIVFPWLVPAVRVEYIRLSPDNGMLVHDLRIIPGVAVLVRPNLKFTLVGRIEQSNGAPPGGWTPVGGFIAPTAGPLTEVEAIILSLATAF
jgi:hypothetical protein